MIGESKFWRLQVQPVARMAKLLHALSFAFASQAAPGPLIAARRCRLNQFASLRVVLKDGHGG